MRTYVDIEALEAVSGGFRWEDYRQSNNVITGPLDYTSSRFTPLETGGLWDHQYQQILADPSESSAARDGWAGWRDDETTGDRTWIDPGGGSMAVEHPNGTFSEPTDGIYPVDPPEPMGW